MKSKPLRSFGIPGLYVKQSSRELHSGKEKERAEYFQDLHGSNLTFPAVMQISPDADARIKELIAQIEIERDPVRFTSLVEELNRLLDEKGAH